MSLLYLDEESDYSEESIYMWQWSLSLHHCAIISVCAWTENTFGNENHKKEAKQIYTSAASLLHIRKGNLELCRLFNEYFACKR